MTIFRFLPILLAAASAPALATGGFTCTAKDDAGIRLSIVTGMAPGIVIAQARLQQGDRLRSTADEGPQAIRIVQSWVDDNDLRLDLADADYMDYVARLRATREKNGDIVGTLDLDGRSHPAVCTSEQ